MLTAVDRDDLADGGATIFANTVRQIHKKSPGAKVECLTGDFAGDLAALDIVLDARPEVLAHNLETVARLQATVRDRRATYEQSLSILRHAKQSGKVRYTKTSLMLGLGETEAEIEQAMDDARAAGVDIFTMGQYLQPTKRHLKVVEFVTPEKFARLRDLALTKGFRQVVSSPLSRSSLPRRTVRLAKSARCHPRSVSSSATAPRRSPTPRSIGAQRRPRAARRRDDARTDHLRCDRRRRVLYALERSRALID